MKPRTSSRRKIISRVTRLDVELLLEEDVELDPVVERKVDRVDVEPEGLDCVGSGVEELRVESPELLETPALDDGVWLEAVVRMLELADTVVEVM